MTKSTKAKRCRRVPRWIREFLSEMTGTFLIILMGTAGIANYRLQNVNDQFGIAFNFGLAVMLAVATAAPVSGAHCNPAVTLAYVLVGRFPAHKMAHYFLAQYVGAFLGSCGVYLVYYEAINAFDGGHRVAFYSRALYANNTLYDKISTGIIFSTYPAPWISVLGSLVDQIVATATYIFGVVAMTSPHADLPAYLHPFILGMFTTGMVIAFGLNCCAVLNPARDFGPRMFQLVAGYGSNVFKPIDSLYWLSGGIIGPYLGGVLGAWLYGVLIIHDEVGGEEDDDEVEVTMPSRGTMIKLNETASMPKLTTTTAAKENKTTNEQPLKQHN